jgi:hypothetical protein
VTRRALSKVCRQIYNETRGLPYTITPSAGFQPSVLSDRLTSGIKALRLEYSEFHAWHCPWPVAFSQARGQGVNKDEVAALALLENLEIVILRLVVDSTVYEGVLEDAKIVEWRAAYSAEVKTAKMQAWEDRARNQVHSVKPEVDVIFEYDEKENRRDIKKQVVS